MNICLHALCFLIAVWLQACSFKEKLLYYGLFALCSICSPVGTVRVQSFSLPVQILTPKLRFYFDTEYWCTIAFFFTLIKMQKNGVNMGCPTIGVVIVTFLVWVQLRLVFSFLVISQLFLCIKEIVQTKKWRERKENEVKQPSMISF